MRPQFYTLLLLAICVTVLAFEPGDLTPLYTFTPAPKPGSCSAEQISALRQHYQEAVGVRRGSSPQGAVQGAVDALDNLKKPIPKKLLHPKQRKTWKRQAQLMQSMFEISADPHSGVGEKNPEFNKLHDSFTEMIRSATYPAPPEFPQRYWLFCHDDFVKFYAPTDEDPTSKTIPKQLMSETHGSDFPQGGWFGQGGTVTSSWSYWFKLPDAPEGTANPLCGEGSVAVSNEATNMIVFCNSAFQFGTETLAATKTALKEGDALDDKVTLAQIWIHEWGHLCNKYHDWPAVDEFGNVDIPPFGSPQLLTYGWDSCVWLAKWKPDQARSAADTFALFAIATYFDNWGWSVGKAQ